MVDDNGDGSYIPVNDFIAPGYIDTQMSPSYLCIDGLYYSINYIPAAAYPSRAVGGWLSLLINMGEGVDVDLYVEKIPPKSVQSKLQYSLRLNKTIMRDKEDTSADYEEMENKIRSAYYIRQGLASGDDFCYMSTLITITAHSTKELAWKVNEAKTFLASNGLRMKNCMFKQEEAFLSTLPICQWDKSIFNKGRRNILTSALASSYPFTSFEVADPGGFMLGVNGANNSLVFIDPFNSAIYANGNMAICGTSGAGKTYTLQCIALRMREQKTQVFIIAPSKGWEFRRAAEAVGGMYAKISPGSAQNINIMEIRKCLSVATELLDGGSDGESALAKKIQQLHVFFLLLIPDITYEERQVLDETLIRTYADYGITDDNDSLIDPRDHAKYKEMPILGDLHKNLKSTGTDGKRLYKILTRYVSGSAKSFNARTNIDLDNLYIVLDISSLTKEMLPIGVFIALDFVYDKIKADRTTKKVIALDEVWTLIGASSSPLAANFTLDVFKTVRGMGGAAIAATQDLKDFFALDNGIYGEGILSNSKIKLIMKMEEHEANRVQEALRLTKSEVQSITRFHRGEGLLVANTNHVIVEVKSSMNENQLITTDRSELEEQVNKARRDQGIEVE